MGKGDIESRRITQKDEQVAAWGGGVVWGRIVWLRSFFSQRYVRLQLIVNYD
ncbi:MAG: hypothetical protein PHS82_12270 [Lachnospiraceae bacterium]|nr:hypothetical protein [Lachnospiraceae bacterium]